MMRQFARRFVRIVGSLLPFLLATLRDRRRFVVAGPPRSIPRSVHEERAVALRDTLLGLGPTFIKIGQVLSTRPDIVPDLYAERLATLQDEIPEDRDMDPREVVWAELGDPFAASLEPIAGGSLAYVYRSRLDGDPVAVKVRRPGVQSRIETDLRVIRWLLPLAVWLAPSGYEYSLRNIADDFEQIILEELDFDREARMMAAIHGNFEGDDRVRIPAVYREHSTDRVLTMEYVEGIKVTDTDRLAAAGHDPELLADTIVTIYFTMGMEHGVFQADPHPGNLAVDDDGRVIIYDFGMSRELTPELQANLITLYRSLVTRNPDELMDALIAVGALDRDVDRAAVRTVLRQVIERLEGRPAVDWRMIIMELVGELQDFPFRIPPDVMLLLRVGTVGEGVCRQLDPDFDFVAASKRFLVEHGHIERGLRETLRESAGDAELALPAMLRAPPKVDRVLDRLERDDIRVRAHLEDPSRRVPAAGRTLGYAVLAGTAAIAAAILYPVDPAVATLALLAAAAFLLGFFRRR